VQSPLSNCDESKDQLVSRLFDVALQICFVHLPSREDGVLVHFLVSECIR
jgi:hypothetical protein